MAKVFIEEASLTAIGDAIRAKTGGTEVLTVPTGMVDAITSIETGGGGSGGNDIQAIEDGFLAHTYPSGNYVNDRVSQIWHYAFYQNKNLTGIKLSNITNLYNNAFGQCSNLTKVDFTQLTYINQNAFAQCTLLDTVILRNPNVVTLAHTNAFSNTKLFSGTGFIYVPQALLGSYQTATNWSSFHSAFNCFRAIEDYPEICGG